MESVRVAVEAMAIDTGWSQTASRHALYPRSRTRSGIVFLGVFAHLHHC